MRAADVVMGAPCARCPFRKDVPIYLRLERREEIARSLADGRDFPCHATVNHTEDEDGEYEADVTGSKLCAGAMRSLMLAGGSNQNLRIAERLGILDVDAVAEGAGAAVWSLPEWTELAEGATEDNPETVDGETCSICEAGCLAPAGYLGAGGGVVRGTVFVDTECAECGEPACTNCLSDGGLCPWCDEDPDNEEDF